MPRREPVLRPKQARFIEEFLIDANATQAAIRAGYSRHTADTQGCRMFRNVHVLRELAKRQAVRAEKLEIDAEWVLSKLKNIVERDPDGSKGRVTVKDLIRALETIGKHHTVQAFRENIALSGDEDLLEAISKARKRARAYGHLLESDELGPDDHLN